MLLHNSTLPGCVDEIEPNSIILRPIQQSTNHCLNDCEFSMLFIMLVIGQINPSSYYQLFGFWELDGNEIWLKQDYGRFFFHITNIEYF